MYNPRTAKPLSTLSSKQHTSSPSRPSRGSSPSSTRRPASVAKEELVKTRWSGFKRVIPNSTSIKQGQADTRIPRVPRGKENISRGGGARVVKPVTRPKLYQADTTDNSYQDDITFTNIKPRSTLSTTPVKAGGRSPTYISSKAVPDLHNKILAKIRLNKRRSRSRSLVGPDQSLLSSKMTDLCTRPYMEKEEYEIDRNSPVSGQDLETYLASMFYMVDTYRTGLVTAGSLLEFLGSLVDLPKLDKWKLEELSRMLDPENDNRYVDQALWSKVGQAWVEMMMDPVNHLDASTETVDEVLLEDEINEEVYQEDYIPADTSYGSVEGVGGTPGCSSREVELENRVSELSYQLARLGEDKIELERNLAGSEDLAHCLTTELELEKSSKFVTTKKSSHSQRNEIVCDQVDQIKRLETQSCLQDIKVENLSKEVQVKDKKLVEMSVFVETMKGNLAENKEKENLIESKLAECVSQFASLERKGKDQLDQLNIERAARETTEEKLKKAEVKLQRLESELSVKEEEVRNLTETSHRAASVESSSNMSSSMIHDVSVDDRVIEESLDKLHRVAPLFVTPSRLSVQSPVVRGPSASSTPHKGRNSSIGEELKELEVSSGFPSPLCEKKEKIDTKVEVLKLVDILGESVRRIIVNQVNPGKSGHVMVRLNMEINNVKRDLEEKMSTLSSLDDLKDIQEKAFDLEEKLSEAKVVIQQLKGDKSDEHSGNDASQVVEQVGNQVEALASLLQSANSALLAVTEETETPPDCSLEPETDLSSWQLDLEGIQLVDWNSQLGRRLACYTKCGKKNSLMELSCRSPLATVSKVRSPLIRASLLQVRSPRNLSVRSPAPGLWQSLYRRLDELQSASEVSRDLLLMAGDSMREQSFNQSKSILFPKTVSCQTSTQPGQTRASQADSRPETDTKVSQTDLHPHTVTPCTVENCFCSASQTRGGNSWFSCLWRTAGSLVLVLLAFTFLCGMEIEQDVYYPITWHPLRQLLGDWLPTPRVIMSYRTIPSQVW